MEVSFRKYCAGRRYTRFIHRCIRAVTRSVIRTFTRVSMRRSTRPMRALYSSYTRLARALYAPYTIAFSSCTSMAILSVRIPILTSQLRFLRQDGGKRTHSPQRPLCALPSARLCAPRYRFFAPGSEPTQRARCPSPLSGLPVRGSASPLSGLPLRAASPSLCVAASPRSAVCSRQPT